MKKIIYIFLMIVLASCVCGESKIESLLAGQDISFLLVNKNQKPVVSVRCNNGEISCNYGTDYIHLKSMGNRIQDNKLYVER